MYLDVECPSVISVPKNSACAWVNVRMKRLRIDMQPAILPTDLDAQSSGYAYNRLSDRSYAALTNARAQYLQVMMSPGRAATLSRKVSILLH